MFSHVHVEFGTIFKRKNRAIALWGEYFVDRCHRSLHFPEGRLLRNCDLMDGDLYVTWMKDLLILQ